MGVNISLRVRGLEDVNDMITNIAKLTFRDEVMEATDFVERSMADKVRVDTGDLKGGFYSEIQHEFGPGGESVIGTVKNSEHYDIYQEHGYMLREGQVIFIKSLNEFVKIGYTHFIPGTFFAESTLKQVLPRIQVDVQAKIMEAIRT